MVGAEAAFARGVTEAEVVERLEPLPALVDQRETRDRSAKQPRHHGREAVVDVFGGSVEQLVASQRLQPVPLLLAGRILRSGHQVMDPCSRGTLGERSIPGAKFVGSLNSTLRGSISGKIAR